MGKGEFVPSVLLKDVKSPILYVFTDEDDEATDKALLNASPRPVTLVTPTDLVLEEEGITVHKVNSPGLSPVWERQLDKAANSPALALNFSHTIYIEKIKNLLENLRGSYSGFLVAGVGARQAQGLDLSTYETILSSRVSLVRPQGRTVSLDTDPTAHQELYDITLFALRPVILNIIENGKDKGTLGYTVLKELAIRTGSYFSQGTVYPELYTLTAEGLIEEHRGLNRHVPYTITEKGRAHMQNEVAGLVNGLKRLLGNFFGGTDSGIELSKDSKELLAAQERTKELEATLAEAEKELRARLAGLGFPETVFTGVGEESIIEFFKRRPRATKRDLRKALGLPTD